MSTPRERVQASLLMRRRTVKRQVNHLYRALLLGLCLLLANYLASFPTADLHYTHPTCMHFCQDGFRHRDIWASLDITYYEVAHTPFWPLRRLSAHVQYLLCHKDGKYMISWSFTQTEISPSHSAMIVILKCTLETKRDCLPCFCCYCYFKVQTGS